MAAVSAAEAAAAGADCDADQPSSAPTLDVESNGFAEEEMCSACVRIYSGGQEMVQDIVEVFSLVIRQASSSLRLDFGCRRLLLTKGERQEIEDDGNLSQAWIVGRSDE